MISTEKNVANIIILCGSGPQPFSTRHGLVEDNFSTDLGWGMVSELSKHITFIMHFISVMVT